MTTTSINTVEAKEEFNDLLSRVSHNKERIILTRRGKEIAALIPIEDFTLLQASQNQYDLHDAMESLKEARNQGSMTLQEFKDQLGETS
jgi:prevent-host-death family protein